MLILPLSKEGESGVPLLTLLLSLACIGMYLLVADEQAKLALAYYPGSFNPLMMLSSVLVHADIFHLLGNLFFFYCFARTVESEVSVKAYLIAFIVFVIATNLAYSASTAEPIPTIGLSGVVWGFMGLFLMRFPKDSIHCLVWYLWVVRTIEVPAFMFILAFLAFDIGAFHNEPNSDINHIAHISGFVAGVILQLVFWLFLPRPRPATVRRSHAVARAASSRDTGSRSRVDLYDRY